MLRIKRARPLPYFMRCVRAINRKVSFHTFGIVFLVLYILFVIWTIKVMWNNNTPVSPTHMHWKPPQVDSKLDKDTHVTAFRPRQPQQVKPMECYNDETSINLVIVPDFHTFDNQIYFLNAFFDARVANETSIRILVMRKSDTFQKQNPIYCLVNSAVDHNLVAIEATVYAFQDNHHDIGLGYGGYMLSCNVKGVLFTNPCKVRLSEGKSFENKTIIMQLLSLKANKPRTEIGVCVPPIWGVVQMNKLVEFIELTHILGADHIFFYQYMGDKNEEFSNPNIHHVLKHYRTQTDKKVTAYPWKLPITIQGNLYYFGQALALQHCLYTNMWKYKYIIFNDIDEFLIPRKVDTWGSLMMLLDNNSTGVNGSISNPFSSYCFKTPYFTPDVSESLRTMTSLLRTSDMHQAHSKCIVHPEKVFEMGIYKIHKPIYPHMTSMDVGVDTALLHHYRPCDQEMPWHIKCFETTRDDIILKYNTKLVENFRTAMQAIATN